MLQYKYLYMYFLRAYLHAFECMCNNFFPNNYIPCYQVVIHTIRLPKQSTVADVINDLKTKVFRNFF